MATARSTMERPVAWTPLEDRNDDSTCPSPTHTRSANSTGGSSLYHSANSSGESGGLGPRSPHQRVVLASLPRSPLGQSRGLQVRHQELLQKGKRILERYRRRKRASLGASAPGAKLAANVSGEDKENAGNAPAVAQPVVEIAFSPNDSTASTNASLFSSHSILSSPLVRTTDALEMKDARQQGSLRPAPRQLTGESTPGPGNKMMLRVRSSPLLSTPIEGKTTGQSNCVNSAKHARRFPRDVTVVIASTDMAIQTDEELSQNMPGWAVRTQELEEELCAKSAELENARAVIVSLETKVEAVERERDGERREREREGREREIAAEIMQTEALDQSIVRANLEEKVVRLKEEKRGVAQELIMSIEREKEIEAKEMYWKVKVEDIMAEKEQEASQWQQERQSCEEQLSRLRTKISVLTCDVGREEESEQQEKEREMDRRMRRDYATLIHERADMERAKIERDGEREQLQQEICVLEDGIEEILSFLESARSAAGRQREATEQEGLRRGLERDDLRMQLAAARRQVVESENVHLEAQEARKLRIENEELREVLQQVLLRQNSGDTEERQCNEVEVQGATGGAESEVGPKNLPLVVRQVDDDCAMSRADCQDAPESGQGSGNLPQPKEMMSRLIEQALSSHVKTLLQAKGSLEEERETIARHLSAACSERDKFATALKEQSRLLESLTSELELLRTKPKHIFGNDYIGEHTGIEPNGKERTYRIEMMESPALKPNSTVGALEVSCNSTLAEEAADDCEPTVDGSARSDADGSGGKLARPEAKASKETIYTSKMSDGARTRRILRPLPAKGSRPLPAKGSGLRKSLPSVPKGSEVITVIDRDVVAESGVGNDEKEAMKTEETRDNAYGCKQFRRSVDSLDDCASGMEQSYDVGVCNKIGIVERASAMPLDNVDHDCSDLPVTEVLNHASCEVREERDLSELGLSRFLRWQEKNERFKHLASIVSHVQGKVDDLVGGKSGPAEWRRERALTIDGDSTKIYEELSSCTRRTARSTPGVSRCSPSKKQQQPIGHKLPQAGIDPSYLPCRVAAPRVVRHHARDDPALRPMRCTYRANRSVNQLASQANAVGAAGHCGRASGVSKTSQKKTKRTPISPSDRPPWNDDTTVVPSASVNHKKSITSPPRLDIPLLLSEDPRLHEKMDAMQHQLCSHLDGMKRETQQGSYHTSARRSQKESTLISPLTSRLEYDMPTPRIGSESALTSASNANRPLSPCPTRRGRRNSPTVGSRGGVAWWCEATSAQAALKSWADNDEHDESSWSGSDATLSTLLPPIMQVQPDNGGEQDDEIEVHAYTERMLPRLEALQDLLFKDYATLVRFDASVQTASGLGHDDPFSVDVKCLANGDVQKVCSDIENARATDAMAGAENQSTMKLAAAVSDMAAPCKVGGREGSPRAQEEPQPLHLVWTHMIPPSPLVCEANASRNCDLRAGESGDEEESFLDTQSSNSDSVGWRDLSGHRSH